MATNGDLARRLLSAAREDELAARSVLRVEGIADPIIGFHTQQAVEKAIKAVLAAKEVEFPFTHDLELLKDFSKESGVELLPTLNGIEDLTPFALAERYGSETPLSLDRDQALKWATAAIAWARDIIEQTKHPREPATQPAPNQTPPSS